MSEERKSDKELQARDSLPDDLKPIFDDFVADYKFAATKHHGRPYVSYIVLAEMVQMGWQLTAKREVAKDDTPPSYDVQDGQCGECV